MRRVWHRGDPSEVEGTPSKKGGLPPGEKDRRGGVATGKGCCGNKAPNNAKKGMRPWVD